MKKKYLEPETEDHVVIIESHFICLSASASDMTTYDITDDDFWD